MDQKKKNSDTKAKTDKPKAGSSKKPQAKKNAAHKKKINPTTQSLIGIFVFALGLALIIAVMYLGYTKFFSNNTGSDLEALDGSASKAETMAAVNNIDKADLENMYGQWTVRYGWLTAYVSLTEEETFQITLFMDTDGYERRVASGTYVYDDAEGVLQLKPSYERNPKPKNGILKTLTRNQFSVITLMSKKDGDLIWVPHVKEGRYGQIHPLFTHLGREDRFIRWEKTQ